MKTIIFVDGENLRYSLRAMRLQQNGLREGDVHWGKFFQKCLEEGDTLIRAYWYQVEQISGGFTRKRVEREVSQLKNKEAEVENRVKKAKAWRLEKTEGHKRMLVYFDNLSEKFPVIEMVRKGVLKIDPINEVFLGEKGLDVALAIGMVKRCENCDKVILISGDLDYAEAIQYVKDKLRKVHVVRLFSGRPPSNRSVAKPLRVLADQVIDIHESEIRDTMLDN